MIGNNETSNATPSLPAAALPIVEGVCFELTTSPGRFLFRVGHRAWFWVAESGIGIPQKFEFVHRGVRFRLEKDGGLQCKLVFCKIPATGNLDRHRERYYYRVRVLAMDAVKVEKVSV